MKRLQYWTLSLLLLLLLGGCGSGWDEYGTAYSGGDEALAGLALAEARRMQKDGVETITLSFLSKEGESVGLPAYEAAFTPAPCRLLIRLPGVETAPAMEESPAPGDAFYVEEKEGITLVFHLTQSKGVRVVEEENRLTFEIQTGGEAHSAYYLFSQAQSAPHGALTPTLCDDGTHRGWISTPYASEAEARKGAASIPGVRVIQLLPQQLPEYAPDPLEAAADQAMAGLSGRTHLLALGRRLLANWDGGERLLLLREEDATLILSEEGVERQLSIEGIQPESILWGVFSPVGQGLLLLVSRGEPVTLYYYNLSNGRLLDLSQSGLGENIQAAVFFSDTLLYTVGDGIFSCRLEEQPQIQQLAYTMVDVPALALWEDRVFFCDMDENGICCLMSIGKEGTRKRLMPAETFSQSKEGLLAVRGETPDRPALVLLDPASGQETVISQGGQVTSALFSGDGTMLYYILVEEDQRILYGYRLSTGASVRMGNLQNGVITPMGQDLCVSYALPEGTVLYRFLRRY